MKIYYKIDANGYPLESKVFSTEETAAEEGYNYPSWEELLLKPKWSEKMNKWVETATDEELNPPEMGGLTREEELAQQVSELEIKDMEKDILIESMGQQLSDLEIMILGGKENE